MSHDLTPKYIGPFVGDACRDKRIQIISMG